MIEGEQVMQVIYSRFNAALAFRDHQVSRFFALCLLKTSQNNKPKSFEICCSQRFSLLPAEAVFSWPAAMAMFTLLSIFATFACLLLFCLLRRVPWPDHARAAPPGGHQGYESTVIRPAFQIHWMLIVYRPNH